MAALSVSLPAAASQPAEVVMSTSAYSWVGDSIIQGPYKAYAPDPNHIISDYSAVPGYFMPIEKKWALKNDISPYPQLATSNVLHNAIFNMGLDEMVNAVEPDSTLRTGREWPGVWTRDVSYSIILAMAAPSKRLQKKPAEAGFRFCGLAISLGGGQAVLTRR